MEKHHDFTDFVSFPSSFVMEWPRTDSRRWGFISDVIPVNPGDQVKAEAMMRIANVNETNLKETGGQLYFFWMFPEGRGDGHRKDLGNIPRWRKIEVTGESEPGWVSEKAPEGSTGARVQVMMGMAESNQKPSITKIDDLKIYRNGELTYINRFSNWKPYIVSGAIVGGATITKALNWW